jgi:hypothetical protein
VSRIHWVERGTGAPKDTDEFNSREVCQCDGRCLKKFRESVIVPRKEKKEKKGEKKKTQGPDLYGDRFQ